MGQGENLYVISHDYQICQNDRNGLNRHRSLVVSFTGFSGAGKTTLGKILEYRLYKRSIRTFLLDGDNMRRGLTTDLDFTKRGRDENIRRVGEVAKLMAEAGLVVIAAFVSPFLDGRQKVKTLIGKDNFVEIFVDTPLEICEKRDTKGLYRKVRNREIADFTGITSPYEAPINPDIHICPYSESPEVSIIRIMAVIMPKIEL